MPNDLRRLLPTPTGLAERIACVFMEKLNQPDCDTETPAQVYKHMADLIHTLNSKGPR